MNSIFGSLSAFVVVIALIPVALWLLKRTPLAAAASQNTMRVVAQLALAPNQKVVTVEVGTGTDRLWLVLGVTPGGITTLHTLPPQASVPAQQPAAGLPFSAWMAKSRPGKGDEHAG
jgi:flagellar protein FliO/FliZ